jgi:hypothetical protein
MQHNVRDQIANFVVDMIDAGSGAGKLVFQDAQQDAVATLTFAKPAFGNSSSGTATANAIGDDTNAIGGTISRALIQDSAGNVIFICTVTFQGGGGDIQLSSTTVGVGQTVSLAGLTYTAPP